MKKSFLLFLIPVIIFLSFSIASSAAADENSILISHWDFNEGSGNVIHDSIGGHNAALNGLALGITNNDLNLILLASVTESVPDTNDTTDTPFITDQDNVNLQALLDNTPRVNKKLFFTDYHNKETYTLDVDIPLDYYLYYKNKPHFMGNNFENITAFVTHDDPIIKELSQTITTLYRSLLSQGMLISNIEMQVVQNSYYSEDWHSGFDEYPKYPIETIFEGNGDCEDLSFLFAALRMAYSESIEGDSMVFSLIRFPNHLGVGTAFFQGTPDYDELFSILSDTVEALTDEPFRYYQYNGRDYTYTETTNPDFTLGEIPQDLRGQPVYIHELFY